MISAKVIADSLGLKGTRLTTMMVTMPRIILAEFNTHRMFSRNSASSRAIPFKKMVESVQNNPFIPIAWQKDHKGMQGNEYFTDDEMPNSMEKDWFKNRWLEYRDSSIRNAVELSEGGVTKQLCNRLLEPFMWTTVIVTATEWENFFALRCPQYVFGENTTNTKIWRSKKDACKDFPDWVTRNDLFWNTFNRGQGEIHIMALAEAMWNQLQESTPKLLKPGEYHIPFGDNIDDIRLAELVDTLCLNYGEDFITIEEAKIKIATARCARVSYTLPDSDISGDYAKDIALHDRLLADGHMSPFEHCARVMDEREYRLYNVMSIDEMDKPYISYGRCLNFRGFIQYRALIN